MQGLGDGLIGWKGCPEDFNKIFKARKYFKLSQKERKAPQYLAERRTTRS